MTDFLMTGNEGVTEGRGRGEGGREGKLLRGWKGGSMKFGEEGEEVGTLLKKRMTKRKREGGNGLVSARKGGVDGGSC